MHELLFSENQTASDLVEDEDTSRTMLTEFFTKNVEDPVAQQYLYREFPEHYIWSPNGDKFYVRMLLIHKRGPISFDDLKTMEGVVYNTFKEAAEHMGLLERDTALFDCLTEASISRMPSALRRLFATILFFCNPVGVRSLWDEFYQYMIEDYPSSSTSTHASDSLLMDLDSKSISDYDLPAVERGKTFLYRAILTHIRSKGQIAIATTTSSLAATMMPRGRTAHSRFKIPVPTLSTSTCKIGKRSNLAQLLHEASVIFWDEATMCHRFAFECLDQSLQDITDIHLPFGGKVIVLGGDFRQVLPIVRHGTIAQTIVACITSSSLWEVVHILKLTENMRARSDPSFSEYLLRIDVIFPSLQENAFDRNYVIQRAIITTTNEHVDNANAEIVHSFPDYLNGLCPSGLPPHKLILKVGAPIILMRNLDPFGGLCNGTRLVCRWFKENLICAEILTGSFYGKPAFIHRIPLKASRDIDLPFTLLRQQFPVRLSFALTINKAQRQTIPHVGIYLPDYVFSHGQLYVALSRGISKTTTTILVNGGVFEDFPAIYTRNVVYR
ncbi:hypothetical protein AQUCO_00500123v1 [Aquilegia coerulea]|uniref:ATP-dependent DNA helicase n=1 Tax=Aquilegia coerulea TaxID=218851 RepID=A0A2G5EQG9_AQUCA|nr:hypothetical protein AQUCO_00500123v1 [Aquilegia coerulea]